MTNTSAVEAVAGSDTVTIDGKTFRIGHGKHQPPSPTDPIICGCVEEVKGYLAGETTWSDHPQCECPVIAAFMRPYNDRLPDDATRAKVFGEYLAQKKCTRSTRAVERRRGYMAADWSVRVRSPRLLRLCGHTAQAARLEALAEIVDVKTAVQARTVARAIRSELWAKRDAFWIEWHKKYEAAAAAEEEAAAAAAAAEEEAAAAAAAAEEEAAAAAAAAAAEEEAAAAAAAAAEEEAAAAEAEAAEAAAAALFKPETWTAASEAAKKEFSTGGSWSSQKAAARSIFDAALTEAGTDRSAFVAYREEMRVSAMDLVARMVALGDAA